MSGSHHIKLIISKCPNEINFPVKLTV